MRRTAIAAFLSTLVVPIPPSHGATRILSLGDSITQGDGRTDSYRRHLWHLLVKAGYSVDFVGSMDLNYDNVQPPHRDFDQDHEGHYGWRADEPADKLPGWLAGYDVDIALVHAGHNDMKESGTTEQVVARTLDDYRAIIARLRADNPRVTILLAQTILTHPVNDRYDRAPKLRELNLATPGLAMELTAGGSPVVVVDHEQAFDPLVMTRSDGVHPNEQGDSCIAAVWFSALAAILDGPVTTSVPRCAVAEDVQPVTAAVAVVAPLRRIPSTLIRSGGRFFSADGKNHGASKAP